MTVIQSHTQGDFVCIMINHSTLIDGHILIFISGQKLRQHCLVGGLFLQHGGTIRAGVEGVSNGRFHRFTSSSHNIHFTSFCQIKRRRNTNTPLSYNALICSHNSHNNSPARFCLLILDTSYPHYTENGVGGERPFLPHHSRTQTPLSHRPNPPFVLSFCQQILYT